MGNQEVQFLGIAGLLGIVDLLAYFSLCTGIVISLHNVTVLFYITETFDTIIFVLSVF